jgi:group II intron reverse transcriptase/maturase
MAKWGRCIVGLQQAKACVMQSADAILEIYHDRGERGLPLQRVYRQLFNPDLFLRSYGKIYRNDGAMTPGATAETPDGMSMGKIHAIIEALRAERHQWTPVRRTHIPKKKGGTRPLGLPTWSDKLLQDVIRSILEAYYEPQFRTSSHGFRPDRGCHTALGRIRRWRGVAWFIEGDISKCFDTIDHSILLRQLGEKIQDGRFLRLIAGLLDAGCLEGWVYHSTLSGTPQGGVVSPVLSNIYLDRLDAYVEDELIPRFTSGDIRGRNADYRRLEYLKRVAKQAGDWESWKRHRRVMRSLPSYDTHDPGFRRLSYVRYADDFLLGFAGPRSEAEAIKAAIKEFLAENLRLELSDAKTLITHGRSEKARFLGYEITVSRSDTKVTSGQRSVNGQVALLVSRGVVAEKKKRFMRGGKAVHRPELVEDDDLSIISLYQAQWRGLLTYYLMAVNVSVRLPKLFRVMQLSLAKTLAAKHGLTLSQVFRTYRGTVRTAHGELNVLRATLPRSGKPDLVAEFGGLDVRWRKEVPNSDPPVVVPWNRRSELVKRLMVSVCDLCGAADQCEVHHIRKLSDIDRPGRRPRTRWEHVMIARRRKTLVLCRKCHFAVDSGRHDGPSITTLESRMP